MDSEQAPPGLERWQAAVDALGDWPALWWVMGAACVVIVLRTVTLRDPSGAAVVAALGALTGVLVGGVVGLVHVGWPVGWAATAVAGGGFVLVTAEAVLGLVRRITT